MQGERYCIFGVKIIRQIQTLQNLIPETPPDLNEKAMSRCDLVAISHYSVFAKL